MDMPRIFVALLLCCALALTRVMGVHVHVAPEAHGSASAVLGDHGTEHEHGVARVVTEVGDHAEDHLSHAVVDADTPDKTSGKLPSLILLALAATISAFLMTGRHASFRRASYDPPPPRRRWHVLPLSQAPPLAG